MSNSTDIVVIVYDSDGVYTSSYTEDLFLKRLNEAEYPSTLWLDKMPSFISPSNWTDLIKDTKKYNSVGVILRGPPVKLVPVEVVTKFKLV
jgi:hypothetical protein